jgi:hypothetical protein
VTDENRPDHPDFSAIQASAGKAETDGRGDAKAKAEQAVIFSDEARLTSQANRYMRLAAFMILGMMSIYFLFSLLEFLESMLRFDSPILDLMIDREMDWHVWLVLGLALLTFAAVPLTLTMALLRMINPSNKDDAEKSLGLVTPQLELAKLCVEALKQAVKK